MYIEDLFLYVMVVFPFDMRWLCFFVCVTVRGSFGMSLVINGGYNVGVPPLSIPNRAVKPDRADGTA